MNIQLFLEVIEVRNERLHSFIKLFCEYRFSIESGCVEVSAPRTLPSLEV